MDYINKMLSSTSNPVYKELPALKMLKELDELVRAKTNPILVATDWVRQMNELRPYQRTSIEYLGSGFSHIKNIAPPTALTAIESIISQQIRLYNSLNSLPKFPELYTAASQLKSMQFAISGLSNHLTNYYALNKRWEELDSFREFTESISDFEEEILEKDVITKQDLEEIKSFIVLQVSQLSAQISRIGKDPLSRFLQIIGIVGFLLSTLSEARNWIPKPEAATKADIEVLRKDIYRQLETELRKTQQHKIILRHCSVSLKPKSRSLIVVSLDSGTDVTILQAGHKWVYISFINPEDNLVQTGWIMKKYLNR